MIWAIGDVNGHIDEYQKILDYIHNYDPEAYTIQLGDLGNSHRLPMLTNKDYVLMGDNDHELTHRLNRNHLNKFGNLSLYNHNCFYISGAYNKGMNNELTVEESKSCIELYSQIKPDIVFSHDGPYSILHKWFNYRDKNLTNNLLDSLFESHLPRYWIFSHHLLSRDGIVSYVKFRCLSQLQKYRIDL